MTEKIEPTLSALLKFKVSQATGIVKEVAEKTRNQAENSIELIHTKQSIEKLEKQISAIILEDIKQGKYIQGIPAEMITGLTDLYKKYANLEKIIKGGFDDES